MSIVPAYDRTEFRLFVCGACRLYYANTDDIEHMGIGCAVRHSPGTCCHHKDIAISTEHAAEILSFVKDRIS